MVPPPNYQPAEVVTQKGWPCSQELGLKCCKPASFSEKRGCPKEAISTQALTLPRRILTPDRNAKWDPEPSRESLSSFS